MVVVAFPGSVNLGAGHCRAELVSSLSSTSCVYTNKPSALNGFSIKESVKVVSTEKYLSVFMTCVWEDGLYQI